MKKLFLTLLPLLPMVCLAQVVKQTSDIYIANSDGQVKLKAVDNTQEASGLPWLEFGSQTNTVFQLPFNGILPVAYGGTGTNSVAASKSALGIRSGTVVTSADGTATNSFAVAFSSVPVVVLTQYGAVNSTTNLLSSITTSNFVVVCSEASVTNQWIAIGAP